jgi:predicted N-acetyltransferase YhbS
MQKNLRNIAERAEAAEFMVCRSGNDIIGSVAYCPAGKGDPSIFKPDMASLLLLAVHPQHQGEGIAKALTVECISRARTDRASSIGLFTSELMSLHNISIGVWAFSKSLSYPLVTVLDTFGWFFR